MILGNIEVWYQNSRVSSYLPLFLIWNIWITRNHLLFEGRNIGTEHTCVKILDQMNSHPLIRKRKRERFVGHPPNLHYPHGFFDGASKNNIGGAGIVLEIIQSHSFNLKLGCGSNTNSRVELLALWTLLFFAAEIGIPSLIFGDSSVVINWENEKSALSALELEG